MSDLLTLYSHMWLTLYKCLLLPGTPSLSYKITSSTSFRTQQKPLPANSVSWLWHSSGLLVMLKYGILCFSLSTGIPIVAQHLTLKFTSFLFFYLNLSPNSQSPHVCSYYCPFFASKRTSLGVCSMEHFYSCRINFQWIFDAVPTAYSELKPVQFFIPPTLALTVSCPKIMW